MSHYTVMVVFDENESYNERNLSEKLAPFDENMEVDPYETTCWCVGRRAERETFEEAQKNYGKTIDELREEYQHLESKPKWEEFIAPLIELHEELKLKHFLYQKPDPECEECNGTGIVTSTYNPESKWDWYQVGGRWSNSLLLKNGIWVDVAKIREIDFEKMEEIAREKALKHWEEAKGLDRSRRYFDYGIEADETKEEFIKRRTEFSTFSVLTSDGHWGERGKMGWFAMVHDEQENENDWSKRFYERFIAPLDEEATICVVDCHI